MALQTHHEEVTADPTAWMPWTYRDMFAGFAERPASPGRPLAAALIGEYTCLPKAHEERKHDLH